MKLAANENVLRVALMLFSIVFGILSVALIALGAVYVDELWWPRKYVGLDFLKLPTLLIILGSLSLLMSIAGCICAKTYNRKILMAYGAVLFVILCFELTVAVIAFINFEDHEGVHTKTHRMMAKQYDSANKEERIFFEKIEEHYKCCGITGEEKNCTNIGHHYYEDYDVIEVISTTTIDPIFIKNGCALAVNEAIRVIAAEVGYIATVFSILRVIEMGYVFLILRLITDSDYYPRK